MSTTSSPTRERGSTLGVAPRRDFLPDEVGPSANLHYAFATDACAYEATGTAKVKDNDGNSRVLPSGLVTFVFTDIEASTRLYKVLGEAAAARVFDVHNELLRHAWTTHDGHEVHTEGDSFFVVFEDPNDAIRACVAAQESMVRADWPIGGEVRIRIGIHCGLAAPRHDDYMALAVHQAARVMSAANGGQILITEAIRNRIEPSPGAAIVRTGTFRLRDFDEAPALYRVDGSSIEVNDRPPRATPANHHNLVLRLTSFIGRDADLVAVNGLLEPGTALTLVGLGGIGKTRLATEVGLEVAATWTSGVWMAELADVVDPDLIDDEIALSIGVESTTAGGRLHDVIEFIGAKSMLLILDNVEHLIEDCARLVPELLRACPNLAVLCTSREPLNCQGEIVYRVQPLDLTLEVDDPTELPSVELFIDRARATSVDFRWTDEALREVLEICSHLDGLPLAIEIAAAQVGVLQLAEIRDGLNNRFRLLRSRDRALPNRHRTMEGLLGWSYQLLTNTEQRAFQRLAVFAGSFSIDAAEAALAGDHIHADDVPELIWALVDKSLIEADLSDSATRYRLFESVQQYAMRLLIDNDDPVSIAVELARWQLDRIAPWHVNDRRWLGDVAIELANIRTVVDLIGDTEPEIAQQLMCSIGRYHQSVHSLATGVEELRAAVNQLTTATPSRVVLLTTLADLYLRKADTASATELLAEAQETQQGVTIASWNDVAVDRTAGEIAIRSGDLHSAVQIATAALTRDLSPAGAARMWNQLGVAHHSLGRPAEALTAFEHELAHYELTGVEANVASAHGNVAEAAWRLGQRAVAAHHQRECLERALAIGQPVLIAFSVIFAANLASDEDDWERSIQLQSAALALLSEAGHELYQADRDAVRDRLRQAEAHLGAEELHKAKLRGQSLAVFEAASLANEILGAQAPAVNGR